MYKTVYSPLLSVLSFRIIYNTAIKYNIPLFHTVNTYLEIQISKLYSVHLYQIYHLCLIITASLFFTTTTIIMVVIIIIILDIIGFKVNIH